MDGRLILILTVCLVTLLYETNACVDQKETFVNCFEQFDRMEKSDSFWESICSPVGKQVLTCLLESTSQCPQLWFNTSVGNITYQKDIILSINPLNNSYDITCERQTVSACEEAWNCFDSVFSTSTESYIGLAKFYDFFCGSEYGITYIHQCFLPAEELCPSTLELLRNREVIKYINTGNSFTYKSIEEKARSECFDMGVYRLNCEKDDTVTTTAGCVLFFDKSPTTIIECLTNKASQCLTEPEINYGQNILQCDYADVTESCIEAACGLPATDFFIRMFEYLKCGSKESTSTVCPANVITVNIGDVRVTRDYGITVPETQVLKTCPAEYKGVISRWCYVNGNWGQVTQNCTLDISDLQKAVDDLKNNITIDGEIFQEVLDNITRITEPERDKSNKPPLSDVRDLIDGITDVFEKTDAPTRKESEGMVNCVGNALDESNKEEWEKLIEEGKDGANTVMRDVDRIVRKLQSQQCPELQDAETRLIGEDDDNLVVVVGKKQGDIRFQSVSSTGEMQGEIYIPAEALENEGLFRDCSFCWAAEYIHVIEPAHDRTYNKTCVTSLTGEVCYGGVDYETISPLLSPKLSVDGETKKFDAGNVYITDVISLLLEQEIRNIEPPLHLKFLLNTTNLYFPRCVSWNFSAQGTNGGGAWTTEGCSLKNLTEEQITCTCTHLTNFAVLMSTSKTTDDHAQILSIISAVGCAISMCALVLTIIFHLLVWRLVRSDRSTILMNLCVALFVALAVFLAGINRVESPIACTIIAAILHYLFLVVFFLMLTQGIEILICVVHVFTTKFRLKLLLPVAWLVPAIIVSASLGATKTEGYGNKEYCWLSIDSGLIWAFIGPAALVIIINIIVIIVVFKKLFSSHVMKDKTTKEKTKTSLRGICVLLPLMGVTWAFGILSVNSETVVFQYIFAVFNSLQGLFIFLFHCVLNRQLRDALRRRKEKKKSIATLESDLKKRSRGDSLGQETATHSAEKTSDDKKSQTSSKKKKKMGGHRTRDTNQINGIEDWQRQQRKQYQRGVRRQISDSLDWTH